MSQSSLVSVCETNTNDQFKPSFRDNRDRNSQEETTSLPTRWNKTKKQTRDGSRVVCKTFREDMSCPASARNIPTDNKTRAKASWQDDDIDITCHQKHMPNQLRQILIFIMTLVTEFGVEPTRSSLSLWDFNTSVLGKEPLAPNSDETDGEAASMILTIPPQTVWNCVPNMFGLKRLYQKSSYGWGSSVEGGCPESAELIGRTCDIGQVECNKRACPTCTNVLDSLDSRQQYLDYGESLFPVICSLQLWSREIVIDHTTPEEDHSLSLKGLMVQERHFIWMWFRNFW